MQVVGDDLRVDSNSRLKCAMPSVKERKVSAFSRSPMWGERKARSPLSRQKVFFSSAPTASTGRRNAAAHRDRHGGEAA